MKHFYYVMLLGLFMPIITNAQKSNSEIIEQTQIKSVMANDSLFLEKKELIFLDAYKEDSSQAVISKIAMSDNRIVTLNLGLPVVRLYDNEGRFIKSIDPDTQPDKKFELLSDLSIDSKKKRIYLLADNLSKILIYDYDLNFVSEIDLKKTYVEFVHVADYFVCRSLSAREYRIDILDAESGKVIHDLIDTNQAENSLNATLGTDPDKTYLSQNGAEVLAYVPQDNSIYAINRNDKRKMYNFGKTKSLEEGNNKPILTHLVASDSLLIYFSQGGFNIFDKTTKNLTTYGRGIWQEDIGFGSMMRYLSVKGMPKKVAFVYYPSQLKETEALLKKHYNKAQENTSDQNKFLEFTSSIKKEDGPILMVADVK